MQVDREFLDAVIERAGNHYPHDIIRATLAVAAERGMVVGEGAVKRGYCDSCDTRIGVHGGCYCGKMSPPKV